MAWKEGYIITGGEFAGQLIGVTNYVGGSYPPGGDMFCSLKEGYRNQTGDLEFWNTEFNKQIDITTIIMSSVSPQGGRVLAKINIVDENQNITGRFCFKILKTTLSEVNFIGYIEDPSGNLIAYVPRGADPTGQLFNKEQPHQPNAKFYLALGYYENNGVPWLCLAINGCTMQDSGSTWLWGNKYWQGSLFRLDNIYNMYGINGTLPPPKTKSDEFGPASEDGGYGPADPGSGGTGGSGGPGPTFDGTSDPWVDTPTKPGVLSFGLLNLYKCDTGSLNLLGETLFPTIVKPPAPPQTGVTDWVKWSGEVAEWIGNVIFAVSDSIWNKDLIDYIVSVHLIPVDVTGGSLEDIKVGPRTLTGILARPISADVIEFDCGTVHVDEYYTSYIDYTATRCRLYIPFYGMVTIKPEYWQSADLSLKYLWNVMDGSFIAKVYSTITRHQSPCTTMIGQYSGSACVHMPLSGANYASMFSQLTGAAGGMAMGAASGNVAMAATSAMALPGALSTDMQTSNAYNASSAFYGHARPYLIIERAISHFPTNYSVEKGLPLLVTKTIGSCSGFTIAESPILDGIPATLEEKERIKQFLQNGVIIK